jgi:hypothetical protein
MIQTGIDEQIHKLVEDVDSEAIQASKSGHLKAKRLRDHNDYNDDDDMKRNLKCKRIQQEDVSTQTTTDSLTVYVDVDKDKPEYLPIAVDSDEDEPEYLLIELDSDED